MKKISLIFILLISSIIYSQEKDKKNSNINPLRIGIKIGVPNIVGGDLEYVTPLLNNRIALFVDYSGFKINPDNDTEAKIKHLEFGTNIYFNNKGRGFYATVSYSKLNLGGSYTNPETVNGTIYNGVASGDVDINTTNIKLGVKLGKKFYFRIEAGYGFGDIPQVIEVTGTESGTGTTKTDIVKIPDVPGISENGLFIGNIGFGISF